MADKNDQDNGEQLPQLQNDADLLQPSDGQPEETENSGFPVLDTLQGENVREIPVDSSNFASPFPVENDQENNEGEEQQKDEEVKQIIDDANNFDDLQPVAQITEPSNILIQDRASRLAEQEEEKRVKEEEAAKGAEEESKVEDSNQVESSQVDPAFNLEGKTKAEDFETNEEAVKPVQDQPDDLQLATEEVVNVVSTPIGNSRPILSQVGTMDQILEKKLPQLKAKILPESSVLHEMVKALEDKQNVFEQAFITVKQETASEDGAVDERIDMVPANQIDKIITYLTLNLQMDLTAFSEFFKTNYSSLLSEEGDQTISLAQFTQAYIEYIEVTHKEGRNIFGENFYILRHGLITEKLAEHAERIQQIFDDVHGEDPTQLPLGRVREFWLQLTLVTKSVMVKRGTEYVLGNRVMDDPECLNLLQKHVYKAWITQSPQTREVYMSEADFEAAFSSDPLQFDDHLVSSEFVLSEIDTFFQENRKVILVDLQALENEQPKEVEDKEEEEEVISELPKVETDLHLNLDLQAENIAIAKTEEPMAAKVKKQMKVAKSKKQPTVAVDPFGDRIKNEIISAPKYVEKDTNYVPAPSQLPDNRQKTIDNNLLEVFNFYCRKFAAVHGDFNQKNANLIVLGLQGFNRFSKDFKVPLTSAELTTVWKKSSNNHQPHDFEQFQKSIGLLGVSMNNSTKEKLTVRQKQLKKEVKKRQTAASNINNTDENKAVAVVIKPLKTSTEKMTDQEIQGELIILPRQIGRMSILSEDQSRIQMYELLEIEHPDRYRSKFPVTGANELSANIMQTKKLISGDMTSTQAGGSKVSQSAVSNVIARLTSNPPVKDRAILGQQRNNRDFVKEMKPLPAPRGKTQTRPASLLSPTPSASKLEDMKKKKVDLIPIQQHSSEQRILTARKDSIKQPSTGAFQRKRTEIQKIGSVMHKESPGSTSLAKLKANIISPKSTTKKAPTSFSPTPQDRQNLAEVHKRIRLEKQSTGRVISVADAKKLIEDDKDKTKPGNLNRKSSIASIKSKGKRDQMSPSKMLPLSKINKGGNSGANNHFMQNKTPSMIDLNNPDGVGFKGKVTEPVPLPASLTFDDIQKMHLTSLNRFGNQEDEFRPQDFLDLDSQDSDNEILAKFKPEISLPEGMQKPVHGDGEMISLLQPTPYGQSSVIQQFVPPPYIATNSMIDEQTGYSNSPKFSIYRLNNQSNMKNDASVFEDQMLTGNMQSHQPDQSQLYSQEFFPPTSGVEQQTGAKTSNTKQPGGSTRIIRKSSNAAPGKQTTTIIPSKSNNLHSVPMTTPHSQKGKAGNISVKKNNVPLARNLLGNGRRSKQGINQPQYGVSNSQSEEVGNGIFESHGQLPFPHEVYDNMRSQVTPPPALSINENISEIGISLVQSKQGHDQSAALGDISMFNDGKTLVIAGSPGRRPAQQVIDDQRSITSKRNSGATIGEGLKPPTLVNGSRHKLKVGSARISQGAGINNSNSGSTANLPISDAPTNQPGVVKRRLGQLAQGKRSQTKPLDRKPQGAVKATGARYTNSAQKNKLGDAHPEAIRISTDSQTVAGVDAVADPMFIRQQSQVIGAQGGQELHSQLPPQLSRDGGTLSNNGSRHIEKSNSAVSSSNQRSLMRAQEQQKKESQNKQRRMNAHLNLQEQNLQKGLSAVSRR